jgi:rRNA maturation protein Rpf1
MNDLAHSIPNSQLLKRGKLSFEELIDSLIELNSDRAIIVYRWKGNPGKIELRKFEKPSLKLLPPIIYLASVRLRREYPVKGRFKAEAVSVGLNSDPETLKLAEVLSQFLNLPLINLKGGTSCKTSIHIVKHPVYKAKAALTSPPALREVGPSFIVRHMIWRRLEKELPHEGQ